MISMSSSCTPNVVLCFRTEAATGVLVVQMRQSCEGLQQHMAALLKYLQVVKVSRART